MSDKKIGHHLSNLSDDAKTYIESEIAYYKLDAYKKLIKATSLLMSSIINAGIILLIFAFLSVGLGLFLGELFGYYYVGFLIIAGVYLIVLFLILIFGKSLIEKSVLKIYNQIFEDI
ncbi:phage holin family protein [Flavobacterium sp. CS20]|jgi:energy-coupling factor transporter transmembrane protein EcfT|uniref:phage holin family protein n=1 Tax=Flavobacterium sp. CS20 TaxID=2775246 RepID=UPI001B3A6193|nr:phage holin family protein [Flavobacterium sp. CS20]QTY28212.1 phage holin family protein [Flavobacterium sp. CS20]